MYQNRGDSSPFSSLWQAETFSCPKISLLGKLSEHFGDIMKVRASLKADPSKGDKIVLRRGRLYIINRKDPNRKTRQG